MKTLIILLLSTNLFANVNIEFIGACDSVPLHQEQVSFSPSNVGQLTVDVLERNNIPFQGSKEGLRSIFNLTTQDNELIIISDREMLAYGWCYKINGFAPELYPHKVDLSDNDHIQWYFAFSRYLDGEWVSQCKPSYQEPRPEFCSN